MQSLQLPVARASVNVTRRHEFFYYATAKSEVDKHCWQQPRKTVTVSRESDLRIRRWRSIAIVKSYKHYSTTKSEVSETSGLCSRKG